MHSGPSLEYRIIGTLAVGTDVNALEYNEETKFMQVKTNAGKVGWVKLSELQQQPPANVFAVIIGVMIAVVGKIFIQRVKIDPQADKHMHFANVEKIFAVLMIVTACAMAFAHGSNDVANAIGPLAAVVNIVENDGQIASKAVLAWWILPLGGIGIVLGLAIFGRRVMATIGQGITHLTPSRGFAAELAAASTVVIASGTGLPISTTQTLVGGVLGVGMARGIAALNLGVVRNIVISWVVTLPIGAGLSIVFFYLLKSVFS